MSDDNPWLERFTCLLPGAWLAMVAACGLMLLVGFEPSFGDGFLFSNESWPIVVLALLVSPVVAVLDAVAEPTTPLIVAFTVGAWLPALAAVGWLVDRLRGRAPRIRRATALRLLVVLLVPDFACILLILAARAHG